jgi:hypothetical protein
MLFPAVISVQFVQSLHGSGAGPFSQFNAFARIRAVLVLPIPRAPTKRYACASLSDSMALFSVVVM